MSSEADDILRECLRRTRVIEAGEVIPGRAFVWGPDLNYEDEHGPEWHSGRWFGGGERLPEARRQRYVRALRALEAAGDVVTASRYGAKVTNIRLTPRGRAKAERLEAAMATAPGAEHAGP